MLNFLDPISIDNLTVLRDDEDPSTFYVLPDLPIVPVDATGLPDFLFMLYLQDATQVTAGEDDGAGYLQFRTVLSLPDDRRAALVTALTAQLAIDQAAGTKSFGNTITVTEPILANPLWTQGTVDLATFQVSDTGLVRQATSQAPVDLTGDLGASFTATLSADGAGVFQGAFDAYRTGTHQLPLVITYNLTYAGRISATLRINAQHSVIHERIWQHATPWQLLDTPFVRYVPLTISEPFTLSLLPGLRTQFGRVFPMIHPEDIPTAIQETITNNSITVEIEEASTGDATADQANRATLLKLATDLLTDSLLPSLTTGATVPGATDSSQTSSNTALLQLDESATPGDATFSLDLTDAMSVIRAASPNAPLQVMISDPATLQACFRELRLADDFFKEVNVQVSTAGVNFSTDGIEKIQVFLRYNETDAPTQQQIVRTTDFNLASATDTGTFQFDTARAADGTHTTHYQYMAQVHWQKGGEPTSVPWTAANSQHLIITPPTIGAINVDAVMTAPAGSVDSARVLLSYTGSDGAAYSGALELSPAAPRGSWLQSTGEVVGPDQTPPAPTYSYQIVYRYQNVEITTPNRTSSEQTIEVPTPFAGSVTFTLVPQGAVGTVTAIAGNFTYADTANGYTLVKPIDLVPGSAPTNIVVPVMPNGPRTASYVVRVENADGTHVDPAPGTLTEGVNFIGASAVTPLTVELHTDLIDFANDVKAIHVTLKFTHADASVTTAEPLFTTAAHDPYTWTVTRAAGDAAVYEADVTFFGMDAGDIHSLTLSAMSSTNVELYRTMTAS